MSPVRTDKLRMPLLLGAATGTHSLWWGSNVRDDFGELKRQQREAWGASIGYHRLSEHFQPAIDRLIEWLEIQPGERALDRKSVV